MSEVTSTSALPDSEASAVPPAALPSVATTAPPVQLSAGKPLTVEKLVAGLALTTTAYYILTFAFEMGFFWRIGLEYMPMFAVTEHVVHAASIAIAAVGALVVGYLGMMYPATFIPRGTFAEPAFPGDPSLPHPKLDWISGFAVAGLFALMAISLGIDTLQNIRREGPTPATLTTVFGSIATVLFVTRKHLRIKPMLWAYPAALTAILLPVALGQWRYESAVQDNVSAEVLIGPKRMTAAPIFLGTDRGIFRIGPALYLLRYDGGMTVRLPAPLPAPSPWATPGPPKAK